MISLYAFIKGWIWAALGGVCPWVTAEISPEASTGYCLLSALPSLVATNLILKEGEGRVSMSATSDNELMF